MKMQGIKPARVELIIDELLLHGLEPGDRHAIRDAAQTQIETLLAEHSIVPAQDLFY